MGNCFTAHTNFFQQLSDGYAELAKLSAASAVAAAHYEEVAADKQAAAMSSSVNIPISADEAELMQKLGLQYLQQHAPERLTPEYQMRLSSIESSHLLSDYQATVAALRQLLAEQPLPGVDAFQPHISELLNIEDRLRTVVSLIFDSQFGDISS